MNDPLKYPVGIQSFEKLREREFVYIDKTRFIYNLANKSQYIFLARPRRFGKSLLLSTFEAYFEGKRELFEGLAIEKLEKEWRKHPVLHLDLSGYNREGQHGLESLLERHFCHWEEEYGLRPGTLSFSDRFHNIIQGAYDKTGEQVAVLIDEYDGPLIAHLDDLERQTPMRDLLKSVYVNLKSCDRYIRFAIVTGVSRFSKVTIFSGLNNLDDISLDREYAEICGVTQPEIKEYLRPGVECLATQLGVGTDKAMDILKENYDGYHFTEDSPDIYNPFSLLLALSKKKIGAYWFDSARPQFVVELMRDSRIPLPEFINTEADASTLSDIENYHESPEAILFQTGYLTIKGYDAEYGMYRLGIPNREVEKGLFQELAVAESGLMTRQVTSNVVSMRRAFAEGNPEKALETLKAYMAAIPYLLTQNKPEIYFENNLYLILSLVGIDVTTEWPTSHGRIDAVLRLPKYIYIIELKLGKTPGEALRQIDNKGYADQFATDGRKIVRIGINISPETRTIDSWTIGKG